MEMPRKCAKCGSTFEPLFAQPHDDPNRPMPMFCRSHARERGIYVGEKPRIEEPVEVKPKAKPKDEEFAF